MEGGRFCLSSGRKSILKRTERNLPQIHPGSLIQRLKATLNSLATLYNNMYYDPVPQAPGDYLGHRGLGRASPNARNAEGK